MKSRIPNAMGRGQGQNVNAMLQQAQRMQQEITAAQEDLEQREFTATSGGGMVSVTMTGGKVIKSLTINPEVVDKDDIETLQDLVVAAVNQATQQVEEVSEKEIGEITGGVSLPGLF